MVRLVDHHLRKTDAGVVSVYVGHLPGLKAALREIAARKGTSVSRLLADAARACIEGYWRNGRGGHE